MILALDPIGQAFCKRRKVEEEMLRLTEVGWIAIDGRTGIDEIDGVQLITTLIALISSRAFVTANRTRAFDVTVGERSLSSGSEGSQHAPANDVSAFVQRPEEVSSDSVMILCLGAGEDVVGEAESLQVFCNESVVSLGQGGGGDTFPVRREHRGCSVVIGAADHEHITPFEPVVAGEDVGGNAETCDVSDVPRAAGIWPSHANQNLLGQVRPSCKRPPGPATSVLLSILVQNISVTANNEGPRQAGSGIVMSIHGLVIERTSESIGAVS